MLVNFPKQGPIYVGRSPRIRTYFQKQGPRASPSEASQAGCGGLIRNEKGNWVKEFYCRLSNYLVLEAEFWAIYQGLVVVLHEGISLIKIEIHA